MATQPLYSVDQVVYLKASAKIGFLEAYKITSIHQIQSNKWVYKIDIAKRPPAPQFVVDRNDLRRHSVGLHFEEAALMLYCDALDMVIAHLQNRTNLMIAKRAEMCEGS